MGDTNKLDIIKYDHQNIAEHCCTAMFEHWLKRDVDASWSKLLSALRTVSVALPVLAGEIEKKLVNGKAVLSSCVTVYDLQTLQVKCMDTADSMMVKVRFPRLKKTCKNHASNSCTNLARFWGAHKRSFPCTNLARLNVTLQDLAQSYVASFTTPLLESTFPR